MKTIKTLDNKLKIVMSSMPHMESVSIGIFVGMGGRYEEKETTGISHFIEHILFKGTQKRDAKQLKQEIEGVGGHFNGFTTEEVTCYLVRVPKKYTAVGLDVLSDMVLDPKIDPSDMEKEKKVILEEIKMYKDQPSSYVHEILAEVMWGDTALGRPLAGYEGTVKKLNRDAILEAKKKAYVPNNIAIVTAGNINEEQIVSDIAERFRGLSELNAPIYEKFECGQDEKKFKFLFKDTAQTNIALGFHTIGRDAPQQDRYAMNVLNIILGANMSSRLFEELRERQGLCYDITSSVKKYQETGAFFIHAGIANTKVRDAVRSVMRELQLIRSEVVSDDELKRAKEFYKGQLLLAFEDTGSRMLWLGDKIMSENSIPEVNGVLEKIDNVNKSDVIRLAGSIFKEEKLNVSCIGPKRAIAKLDFKELTEIK